jgi:hypothetical protein
MQSYGQHQSGADVQSAANYNAAVHEQRAQSIEVKKGLTRQQYERLFRQMESRSVAAIAGSGYDYSGSFLEVVNDSLTQIALDEQIAIYNLEVEKMQAHSSAEESRARGAVAARSGNVNALSSLLTQGNEWYQKYGGFGGSSDGGQVYTGGKVKSGDYSVWGGFE